MRWFEVTVHTTQEATELVAHRFHELGAGGVAIEDPEVLNREWDTMYGELYHLNKDDYPAEGVLVKGYIPETTDMNVLHAEMSELLSELATFGMDVGAATIAVHEVFEEDWAHAWKKYYKPVQVSARLWIKPTWEELDAASGVSAVAGQAVDGTGVTGVPGVSDVPLVIEMDPGMAFGTGTHPTTLLCLRALETYLDSDKDGLRLIDVGTGTGILAIAAAKFGAGEVLAIDLDPVAVESAVRNVSLNGVSEVVDVRQGDLLTVLGREWDEQGADLVVANILAEIIVTFVADVWQALRPGGLYITSGMIGAKAEMVKRELLAIGFGLVEEMKEGDWVALVAQKPRGE